MVAYTLRIPRVYLSRMPAHSPRTPVFICIIFFCFLLVVFSPAAYAFADTSVFLMLKGKPLGTKWYHVLFCWILLGLLVAKKMIARQPNLRVTPADTLRKHLRNPKCLPHTLAPPKRHSSETHFGYSFGCSFWILVWNSFWIPAFVEGQNPLTSNHSRSKWKNVPWRIPPNGNLTFRMHWKHQAC